MKRFFISGLIIIAALLFFDAVGTETTVMLTRGDVGDSSPFQGEARRGYPNEATSGELAASSAALDARNNDGASPLPATAPRTGTTGTEEDGRGSAQNERGTTQNLTPTLSRPHPNPLLQGEGASASERTSAYVARVIDGDTIELASGERVRYIGVNTPESVDPRRPVQCFGKEASDYNKELVEGQWVNLEKDITDRDKYGRLLRYVWMDDTLINEKLVRDGYAQVKTYPPDVKYVDRYRAAQQEARAAARGLWSACN